MSLKDLLTYLCAHRQTEIKYTSRKIRRYKCYYVRHSCSSDPSGQSRVLSQCRLISMQLPSSQRNSFSSHSLGGGSVSSKTQFAKENETKRSTENHKKLLLDVITKITSHSQYYFNMHIHSE